MSDATVSMFIVGIAVGLPMIAVTITEITMRLIAFK